MEPIYVRVTPEDPDGPRDGHLDINAIRVGVSYVKGRGVYASLHPAMFRADGMVLISPGSMSKFLLVEKAARLDRDRLAAQEQVVANQIDSKLGEVWRAVEDMCSDNRVTPTSDVEIPKFATA
jgi:hypothetical protein